MKNNFKNITVTVSFMCTIFGLMLANILMPDKELSYSERRTLAKPPAFSMKKLLTGDYFEEYEKYFLDQFIFRDGLRELKALASFNVFRQKDNNNIYIIDGNIFKMEYPLNEKAIINAAKKFNEVYAKYLEGKKVSYAIIPDKNYFAASDKGYLSMDYDKLLKLLEENVHNMNYIDVFHALKLEDYYKTDIHWSQDRIRGIADMLLRELRKDVHIPEVQYEERTLYPFYGSYYGQAAMRLEPDKLVYLTNDLLERATVYDHIDKTYSKVYREDKFGTIDSYDFFLCGAKSVLTVSNPEATTDKELIIFRDSFGSSLAPLLLHGYAKITLIDLRYMGTDLLENYVDFSKDQDVLFIYNTLILNNSYMLK
ncbi:DHHW family protein [Clostridium thermarum]|uniref:DHHW family protein n=1 Tax=Clostridium thermarum TaxID=1716543 RepID=UPI001120B95F|nr:DHHW family protein [Clostridium thermarum]